MAQANRGHNTTESGLMQKNAAVINKKNGKECVHSKSSASLFHQNTLGLEKKEQRQPSTPSTVMESESGSRRTIASSAKWFSGTIPPPDVGWSEMRSTSHSSREHRRATSATRWVSSEHSSRSTTPVSQHRVWKRGKAPSAGERRDKSSGASVITPTNITPGYVIRLAVQNCNNGVLPLEDMMMISQSTFLNHLVEHISLLPGNKEANLSELMSDVTIICKSILNLLLIPVFENVCKVVYQMEKTIMYFKTYEQLRIDERVRENFHQLLIQINEINMRWNERKAIVCKATKLIKRRKDFRKVSPVPSADDILADALMLAPTGYQKNYDAVDTYLCQQFYRFRNKHIVKPLHDSISDYLNRTIVFKHITVDHIGNVRFHRNVRILYPVWTKSKIGVVIHFDPSQHLKQKNSLCEKFIFGSLLVLTANNFSTMILATVLETNKEDVKNGNVVVELIDMQCSVNVFDVEYTMAETDVYFKPICNVARLLQKKGNDRFPLKKYIVYGKREVSFHNSRLLNELSYSKLDPAQVQCLKAAVTADLVLVSGAPGTGKTYLTLKALQALLRNDDESPILIICKTSQVLDKFLLGVLQFTTRVVRIGGANAVPQLVDYTLETKRSQDCPPELVKLQHCRAANMISIRRIAHDIELLSRNEGVISLRNLKLFRQISDKHCKSFFHPRVDEDSIFYSWLVCEMYFVNKTKVDIMPHSTLNNQRVETCVKVEKVKHFDENGRRQLEEALENEPPYKHIDSCFWYIETVRNLEREKKKIKEAIEKLQANWTGEQDVTKERDDLRFRIRNISIKLNRFTRRLSEISRQTEMNSFCEENLLHLHPDDRWRLYSRWVHNIRHGLLTQLGSLEVLLAGDAGKVEAFAFAKCVAILKEARVVGVTLDKAVDLELALGEVKPKLVIVLEAADLSEPHVVAAIPDSCRRLLLVGHEPTFETEDSSLLGRLSASGVTTYKLTTQHRMRPEIALLTSPLTASINTEEHFHHIGGIARSVYFLSHNIAQVGSSNLHEVKFLVALCRHIRLQGYRAVDIGILAFHADQANQLQHECEKCELLKGVAVEVVDTCRAMESEVVLLSLVGSTALTTADSYKLKLALTRARAGLYMIGHSEILAKAQGPWHAVCEALRNQNAIGKRLELVCQVHPKQITAVRQAQDFGLVPEGGCSLLCGAMLPCGHTCEQVCHMTDKEHLVYRCHRPCDRMCSTCRHKCQLQCWQDCGFCMEKTLKS